MEMVNDMCVPREGGTSHFTRPPWGRILRYYVLCSVGSWGYVCGPGDGMSSGVTVTSKHCFCPVVSPGWPRAPAQAGDKCPVKGCAEAKICLFCFLRFMCDFLCVPSLLCDNATAISHLLFLKAKGQLPVSRSINKLVCLVTLPVDSILVTSMIVASR